MSILFITSTTIGLTQIKSNTDKQSITHSSEEAKEFDLTVEKLPPDYSGDNFKLHFVGFQTFFKYTLRKDQFESNQEHEARVEKFKSEFAPLHRKFAFVRTPSDYQLVYKSENQYYEITTSFTSICGEYLKAITLQTTSEAGQSYQAQNAFGVKVNVSVENINISKLIIKNKETFLAQLDPLLFDKNKDSFTFKLKLPSDRARYYDGEFRLLFVGKIDDACEDSQTTQPTFANPNSKNTRTISLAMNLFGFYIFTENDGLIHYRYGPIVD